MVVRAHAAGWAVEEAPVAYRPRVGRSKVTGTAAASCGPSATWRRAAVTATLAVIAKAPRPGRVKTRLCPPCTPDEAAAVAEAALRDTLAAVRRDSRRAAGSSCSTARPARGWVPASRSSRSRGGGLDERLEHAFATLGGPTLVIGMDTPQVTPALLTTALARRAHRPARRSGRRATAATGRSACGTRARGAVRGVPMSHPDTYAAQHRRLRTLGIEPLVLPALVDVDDIASARAVAAAMPASSAFARRRRPPRIRGGRRVSATPLEVFGRGLATGLDHVLELADGTVRPVPFELWLGPATAADERVLDRALPGPVLDVGCGPGRHVRALARRGVLALGVDVSPAAVSLARRRGAAVVEGSVFQRVPGAGLWGSALLLDGNLGIGGDPERAAAPRPRAAARPAVSRWSRPTRPARRRARPRARLDGPDATSDWFAWAVVGADEVGALAARGRDDGRRGLGGRRTLVRRAAMKPPPGPSRPGFWRSPLRGPWLTSLLGLLLLPLVAVVAVTGLLSHAAYNPGLGANAIVPGHVRAGRLRLADAPGLALRRRTRACT